MKTVSEKLMTYLEEQRLSPAELAKSCGLDRSTVFQYVHGRRPIKNPKHLEQIINHLALSIPQREDLLKTYEIELVGYELYCRRQKTERLIRSLPALSETPNTSVYHINRGVSMNISFRPGMIRNHLELSQTMFSLLHTAHQKHSPVKILMQPGEASLLNLLLHPEFTHSGMEISHIICLDRENDHKVSHNIDTFSSLLPYFLLLDRYFPFYFYGDTDERFGPSNLFPYMLWTEHGVLQISAREDMAVFHTEPDIIDRFKKMFEDILNTCEKLGDIFRGLNREISWYSSYINEDSFQDAYELCTGLCSTQFWDRPLIHAYLNPALSQADQLGDMLAAYCERLLKAKKAGHITVIMNPRHVQSFIRTGRFTEYPDLFFSRPLDKKDRLILINRVLDACEEGWYQLCFIDEEAFPLQLRWEMCGNQNTATIQYFHQEQFRTLFIQEQGFADEIYDYLKSLSQSEHAMSKEESVRLLRQWAERYLSS